MSSIFVGNGLGLFGSSLTQYNGYGGSGTPQVGGPGRDGAYVNAATGNMVLQSQDEFISALGLDDSLFRTYNSQGLAGANGLDSVDSWRLSAYRALSGVSVVVGTSSYANITRTGADGHLDTFAYNSGASAWYAADGSGASAYITYSTTSGQWTYHDGSTGSTELYDAAGKLLSTTDANGNTLAYTFTGNLITQIKDASGQIAYLDYDASNRLTDIRVVGLTAGATSASSTQTLIRVKYGYDAQNRLTSVSIELTGGNSSTTFDGNVFTTNYTYQSTTSNLITRIAQSDGSVLSVVYDSSGRVSTLTDGLGRVTGFNYATGGQTTVTDPLGNATTYVYDAAKRLTQVILPAVNGSSNGVGYQYDASNNVIQVTDAQGRVTTYGYDAHGNQISAQDALGDKVTRTYDANNHLLLESVSGPALATPLTTHYAYDANGNLRFVVTPQGRVTEYRYAVNGELVTTVVYSGAVFDGSATGVYSGPDTSPGAVLTVTDLTHWLGGTNGNGGVAVNQAQIQRSDTTYDLTGQVKTVTTYAGINSDGTGKLDGTQSLRHYVYDLYGRLLMQIDPRAAAAVQSATNPYPTYYNNATALVTSYAYDGLSRTLSVQNGLGQSTTTVYGSGTPSTTGTGFGITLAVTAPTGVKTVTAENSDGWVTAVSHQTSTGTALDGPGTTYAYDYDGRLVQQTDATGQKTYYLYDARGRQVGMVSPQNELTETVYNNDNQIISVIRYAAAVTVAPLDANGNSKALSALRPTIGTAQNRSSYNFYDTAGRLIYAVDALGYVTGYSYNAAGRMLGKTEYFTALSTIPTTGNAADVAITANAADRATRYFYDGDGKLLGTLDPDGYLTQVFYDAAGEVKKTTTYATVTNSSQRASGALSALIPASDTANDQSSYTFYDGEGRVSATIDAGGYLTANVYDTAGNLKQQIRYATPVSYAGTGSAPAPTTSASDQTQSWVYDALGRLTQQVDVQGTSTLYNYDPVSGFLTSVTSAATGTPSSPTAQNDQLGRGDARTTTYLYDPLGRVTTVLLGVGSAAYQAATTANKPAVAASYGTQEVYDTAGRKIRSIDPDGHTTYYYYDGDGRLVYTVDGAGEVSGAQYDAFGDVVKSTQYASRISLTGLTGGLLAGDSVFSAAIAAAGFQTNALNRIASSVYGDNRGLVTQTTDGQGFVTTESYDHFGELQTRVSDVGASHASGLTRSDGYIYNARGLLTQRTTDSGGLALLTSNSYDAFGRLIQVQDASGTLTKMQYDRLGRTVVVTDGLGQGTTTTYDAFGRVLTLKDRSGAVTGYAYTDGTQTQTITDADGDVTTTVHNRQGQTIQVSIAKAGVVAFSATYAYDADGNLLSTKDGDNNLSSSGYDDADLLVTSTDANGIVTAYTYDAANRLLTKTLDPSGLNLWTRYAYNAFGQAFQVTDSAGVTTETVFDNDSRSTAVILDTAGLKLATTYTYDALGDTLSVIEGRQAAGSSGAWTFTTLASSRTTQYTYDKLGRQTSQVVDPGSGKLNLTTSYAYDKDGNLVKKVDANGNIWRYAYDADNHQVYAVDPLGEVTQTSYDGEGRVTRTARYATGINTTSIADPPTIASIQALLPASPNPAVDRVSWNSYDSAGRLAFSIDGVGDVTGYGYDAVGHVTQTTRYAVPVNTAALLGASSNSDVLMVLATVWSNDLSSNINGFNVPDTDNPYYQYANGQFLVTVDPAGTTQQTPYIYSQGYAPTQSRPLGYRMEISTGASGTSSSISVGPREHQAGSDATLSAAFSSDGFVYADFSTGQSSSLNGWFKLGAFQNNTTYVVDVVATATSATLYVYVKGQPRSSGYTYTSPAGSGLHFVNPALYILPFEGSGTAANTFRFDNFVVYQADASGNPAPQTSAADQTARSIYDTAGRLTYAVDALGDVTGYKYDADGQVTQTIKYATPLASGTPMTAAGILAAVGTGNSLPADQSLLPGQSLYSNGGAYRLTYQTDGNLVLFNKANQVLWASNTSGTSPGQVRYQGDGNLVIYNQQVQSVWASGVNGSGGKLVIQDDGDVVTYAADGTATWSAYAGNLVGQSTGMQPDQRLTPGQSIYSDAGGSYHLAYQTDGNLVLYAHDGRALWSSNTAGTSAGYATYQSDGNFVIYNQQGQAVWNTATFQAGGSLFLRSDGNLVIYAADGSSIIWSSGTGDSGAPAPRSSWTVYDNAGRVRFQVDALGSVTETQYDADGRVSATIHHAQAINTATLSASPKPSDILAALNGAGFADDFGKGLGGYALSGGTGLVASNGQLHLTDTATASVALGARISTIGANSPQVYRAEFTPLSTTGLYYFGAVNGSGTTLQQLVRFTNGQIQSYTNNNGTVAAVTLGSYSAGVTYVVEVQVTSTGSTLYVYPKGSLRSSGYSKTFATTWTNARSYIQAGAGSGESAVLDNLTESAALPNDGSADQVTSSTYDAAGRLISTQDAAGYVQSYTYDSLGNKQSYTNQNGYTWNYQYDGAGRMVLQVDPATTTYNITTSGTASVAPNAATQLAAQKITYDNLGNVKTKSDGYATGSPGSYGFTNLRTTTYNYDALGRQIQTIQPTVGIYTSVGDNYGASRVETTIAPTTSTLYDALGNAIVGRNARGTYTYKIYDQIGRLVYEMDADHYATGYTYDAFGNQLTVSRYADNLDPYDSEINGLQDYENTLTSALGNLSNGAALSSAAEAAQAKANLMIGHLDSTDQRTVTTTYDALNRKIRVVQPAVAFYLPTVNAGGVVGTTYSGTASPTTTYAYDAFGDLTTQSVLRNPQANEWVSTYSGYDKAGRQTDVVDGLGYYTRQAYDAFGNLVQSMQYAKPLAAIPASLPNFASFTPPAATAASAANPDAAGYDRVVQYGYDQLNRQISQTRVGVLTSALDAGSNLTQAVGGQTSFTAYDGVGNVVSQTDAQGDTTVTYYNALGQIVGVQQPARVTGANGSNISVRSLNASYSTLSAANEVVLQWDSLQSWGTGDVSINVTYEGDYTTYTYVLLEPAIPADNEPAIYQKIPHQNHGTFTATLNLAAAASYTGAGVSVTPLSNMHIDSVQVQKQVNGSWVDVFDTAASGGIQPRIEIGQLPASVASVSMVATLSGGGATTLTLSKIGNMWVAPYASLAAGSYAYTLTAKNSSGALVDLRSVGGTVSGTFAGTFSVNRPSGASPWIRADSMPQTVTPLTAYEYDLLGNQIAQIKYASPNVAMPANGAAPAGQDAANDQYTYSRYDALGRVIETVEINNQGNASPVEGQGNHNTVEDRSYDALGNVQRVWTTLTTATGASLAKVQLYGYDLAGQQTYESDILRDPRSTSYTAIASAVTYDAYGEQILKSRSTSVNGAASTYLGSEFYDYDAAGRLWQTDEGGVDTVYRYDLQGDSTAKVLVPGTGNATNVAPTPARLSAPSAVTGVTGGIETDIAYDRLGRAIQQRDQSFTQSAASPSDTSGVVSVSQSDTASGSCTGNVTKRKDGDANVYDYTVHGTFTFNWPTLASLGSAPISVTAVYGTAGGGTSSYTWTGITASQYVAGGTLTFDDDAFSSTNANNSVPTTLVSVIVTAQVGGSWQLVRNSASTSRQLGLIFPSSYNVQSGTFYYRAGTSGGYTAINFANGGSDVAVPLAIGSLANGTYQYYFNTQSSASGFTPETLTFSGTFTVSGGQITAFAAPAAVQLQGIHNQTVDRWGNVNSITDARNSAWVTHNYYDDQNHLIEAVQPTVTEWNSSTGAQAQGNPRTWSYYDNLGRKIAARDADGNLTRDYYDSAGNLVEELRPDGGTWSWGYDVLGRQTQTRDGTGSLTNFSYDQLNQLLKQDQGGFAAGDRIETYTYDEAGNRTSSTDGAGDKTRYLYDSNNELVEELSPLTLYSGTVAADANYNTQYWYDAFGRKTQLQNYIGGAFKSETWGYDYFGRQTAHTDLGGSVYSNTYNGLGQLIRQTNTATTQTESYAGSSTNVTTVGENLTYAYYSNGWLASVADNEAGRDQQLTSYQYDVDGNHTLERTTDTVTHTNFIDTQIHYDALGRTSALFDDDYSQYYGYDANGNRIHVGNAWYQYDAENRITLSAGTLSGSAVSGGTQIGYDMSGHRLQATAGSTLQLYTYDPDGQLVQTKIANDGISTDAVPSSIRVYDQAGRMVSYQDYGVYGSTTLTDSRTMTYNANGMLIAQTSSGANGAMTSQVSYTAGSVSESGATLAADAGYYDGMGNASKYTAGVYAGTTTNNTLTYTNTYLFDFLKLGDTEKTYREQGSTTQSNYVPGTTTWTYDAQGNAVKITNPNATVTEQDLVNDTQGHILQQVQNQGAYSSTENFYFVNGAEIGHLGGMEASTLDLTYQPVSEAYPPTNPGGYVVQPGDTLQGIALNYYGDSSLWYLIADANGVASGQTLQPGLSLIIPNQIGNLHNNSTTFRPYNSSQVIGDTTPLPKYVPPPPPAHSCNPIVMVIVAVVAVVATIITAGAAAVAFGAVAADMGTFAAGTAVLTGAAGFTGAAIGAAAIGGAVGSMASQLAGDALGVSHGISWKQVAIGAIGSAASAGVGSAIAAGDLGSSLQSGLGALRSGAGGWQAAEAGFASGALDSALTQGVGVATGLQHSFSWSQVAAGALVSGALGAMGSKYDPANKFNNAAPGQIGIGELLGKTADGIVSSIGGTEIGIALGGHGKIDLASVAADSFGNALGSSIVGAIEQTPGQTQAQAQQPQQPIPVSYGGASVPRNLVADSGQLYSDAYYTDSGSVDASPGGGAAPATTTANQDVAALNATQAGPTTESVTLPGVTVTGQRQAPEEPSLLGELWSDVKTVGSDIATVGKYVVGGAELLASGVYNEAVRIAGGVASIPFALFDGADAAVAVQQGFKDTLGYTPQSSGAQSIESALQPMGQFLDKNVLNPLHNASESLIGDAATTVLFSAVQAGAEIAGVVGGVGAVRSAADRLLTEGVEGAAAGSRLAIAGQVAATPAEQEAIVSNYLRDQFGTENVGEQVRLQVTYPDGSTNIIKPDALVRLPDGSFQINDAKLSYTKDLSTADLTDTFSTNQKPAFAGIADGSATVQIANSKAGAAFFGDTFEIGKTINVRPQIQIYVNTPQGQLLRPYP